MAAIALNSATRKRLLILVLVGFLTAAGLYALPVAVRAGAEMMLEQQGLQAHIEDVDLNLFTGRFAVLGARGQTPSGEGFRLDRLHLKMRYKPLFERRVHFSELQIEGTRLDIIRTADNRISVAGIQLPVADKDKTSASASGSTWGFGLDQVAVQDTELHYRDEQLDETLVVKATSVTDVASWAPNQAIGFTAEGALKGSPVQLSGSLQPFGEVITVDMQVKTRQLPLDMLSPYAQVGLEGELHADLSLKLRYSAGEAVRVETDGSAEAAMASVSFPDRPLVTRAGVIAWQGKLAVNIPADQVAVPGLDGEGVINAADLQLLHSAGGGGTQPLLTVKSVNASPLRFKEARQLEIGQIRLAGLDGQIARDESSAWNFEKLLPDTAEEKSNENEEEPGRGLGIKIGTVEIAGNSRLAVADAAVEPDFETELQEIQVVLEDLDSATPQAASPLKLSAKVGRYGQLDLKGSVKPFAGGVDLEGELRNANLVPLSGYTGDVVGYRVRQGTVTSEIDIELADGKIDAVFDLVLNKLEVASAENQSGEFEQQTGMPLGTALGLMRDRDDNIRLELPITGDIANPDVNIDGIIQKAVFKAVQAGVLSFYSPLGVVMAADKLVQFATALRFKPVKFEPGSVLLSKDQAAYIEQMAGLLAARPQVQASVCGFAVSSDRQKVAERVAEQGTTFFGLFKPEVKAGEVPEDALLEVAGKRANIVSDYLLSQGVSEDQLISCEPSVELQQDSIPRVEVSM